MERIGELDTQGAVVGAGDGGVARGVELAQPGFAVGAGDAAAANPAGAVEVGAGLFAEDGFVGGGAALIGGHGKGTGRSGASVCSFFVLWWRVDRVRGGG